MDVSQDWLKHGSGVFAPLREKKGGSWNSLMRFEEASVISLRLFPNGADIVCLFFDGAGVGPKESSNAIAEFKQALLKSGFGFYFNATQKY